MNAILMHKIYKKNVQNRGNTFYKSKKAVVEVQFGWIFVIIVGALILLFFLSVVKSTTKGSTEAKYLELKNHLSSMMSQSEVDVGTTRTIGMPAIVLGFDCGGFGIKDSSDTDADQFPYKTFFSPNTVKGREIITYSKYWEMPYTVDYFVYVTSKEVRYNFVLGECNKSLNCLAFFQQFFKEFPANITFQVLNSSADVTENNYYKERFIFINQNPETQSLDSSIISMNNEDVTAINISEKDPSITYFKKEGDKFKKNITTSYLGFPMLLGAIFSEAPLYKCNVNKSLQ